MACQSRESDTEPSEKENDTGRDAHQPKADAPLVPQGNLAERLQQSREEHECSLHDCDQLLALWERARSAKEAQESPAGVRKTRCAGIP